MAQLVPRRPAAPEIRVHNPAWIIYLDLKGIIFSVVPNKMSVQQPIHPNPLSLFIYKFSPIKFSSSSFETNFMFITGQKMSDFRTGI